MSKIFPALVLSLAITHSAHAQDRWYEQMQIGPAWSNTFADYYKGEKRIAALKGILLDLGDDHRALFDTETLRLVTAYKGKMEWGGTPWGDDQPNLTLPNKVPIFNTAADLGWAGKGGSFDDKRDIPGHGNLKDASFKGYYRSGSTIVLEYIVNGARIFETVSAKDGVFTRTLRIGKRDSDLTMLIADEPAISVNSDSVSAKSEDGLEALATGGLKLFGDRKGRLIGKIPRGNDLVVQIVLARGTSPKPAAAPDFAALVKGGAPLYPEIITTSGSPSTDTTSPYVTEQIPLPEGNPWRANMRFGGFDFIDEDSAALSSWNGDVWVVRGLKGDWTSFKWQRIASGLFETLGVKVVNGIIHVHGRDQITQLIDLNGDGETDHFKVFNRDVIISSNFHEFAFDLQTDAQGNFYFSKGAPVRGGGRGFDTILPHHGIVAKVSPDGSKFQVIATGLRAPGGLGVGPNGEITTGENEGTWQPCCKINYIRPGKFPAFLGTEPTRGEVKSAYLEPLCYLPMSVDNSGGSQVWVPKGAKFGVNPGDLLHLSYGQSSVLRVLPVTRGDTLQGGVVKLPITLQSSAMRARFHADSSMYVLGFRGWQTNAASECAFQRVRYNPGVPLMLPEKLEYTSTGVKFQFPHPLNPELANDPSSYTVERWNYVRGPQYGSGEFSVDRKDRDAEENALVKESQSIRAHDAVEVKSAKLSSDGKTVELVLTGMKPSHTLKVSFDLEGADGKVTQGDIVATVYKG